MAAATLIVFGTALRVGSEAKSGAAVGEAAESSSALLDMRDLERAVPERCPWARRGLRFYRARHGQWVAMRSSAGQARHKEAGRAPRNCADARYLAGVWRERSFAARQATERWMEQWAWWRWLPYSWQARSRCELGYPLQPRSWRSNVHTSNGNFQGFVNFYAGTWDGYRSPGHPSEAYLATPREQYEVALAVAGDVGLGAWGSCG